MTTKKFQIQERENNAWLNQAEYATRKEALATIAKILAEDEKADPQNFKIVEVEVNDMGAILMQTANNIAELFADFNMTFEIKDYMSGNGGFIEMRETSSKFPNWSAGDIKILFKIIDDMNNSLPESHEVYFTITHNASLRLMYFVHIQ